ncbi:hypothetical protein WM08_07835 [Burkholderia ubonensis]|nr:hypothetical protein WL78_10575 [Burkholderia ubonensis]KWI93029.1 hypothetical protein WM08_07835 [Burkholderia ubonensis]
MLCVASFKCLLNRYSNIDRMKERRKPTCISKVHQLIFRIQLLHIFKNFYRRLFTRIKYKPMNNMLSPLPC